MARADEYSLLLLAGGKSSRMGSPKPELLWQGKTFLMHMLDKARDLGIQNCYISGYTASRPDVRTVWDIYPDRGPLGGLQACMDAMDTPYCLVLPVDAPTLSLRVLEELLAAHESAPDRSRVLIWEHGDRQEPLIAVYPAAMAETIAELIRDHAAPVFRALDRWGYDRLRLELPEDTPVNINTPELYEILLGKNP